MEGYEDILSALGGDFSELSTQNVRAAQLRKQPVKTASSLTQNVNAMAPPTRPGAPTGVEAMRGSIRGPSLQQAQNALPGLYEQQEEAMKPADYTGMQEYAKTRAKQGGNQLLLALAAQTAGKDYAPMSAMYLKQAMASREPLKTATGFITDTGEHVEDAQARADIRLKQIGAQIAKNEQIINSAATAAEKAAAQQETNELRRMQMEQTMAMRQMSQSIAQGNLDLRRDALADRQAARDATAATKQQGNATIRKEMAEADGMESSLSGATEALRKASGGGTGWFAGMAQEKLPGGEALVGKMRDDDTKNAIQQMTFVTDAIRHARFGSALTATEKASAHQYLPSPYDDRAALIRKAEGLQDLIRENNRRIREEFGRTGEPGYGPRGETAPKGPAAPGAAPSVQQRAAGYLGG